MSILPFIFQVFLIIVLCSGSGSDYHHSRKILHQPLYQLESLPPPRQQQKYPFSSPSWRNPSFFPTYPSPPPPPAAAVTLPANISSLPLSGASKPISRKLVAVAISLSLLSASVIVVAAMFLFHRGRRTTETVRLFPSDAPASDKPLPPSVTNISGNSSEFLYLGTLRGMEENNVQNVQYSSYTSVSSMAGYQRLGSRSPELHPLPPLPHHIIGNPSPEPLSSKNNREEVEEDEEQYFSPTRSSKGSPDNSPNLSPQNEIPLEHYINPGSVNWNSTISIFVDISPQSSEHVYPNRNLHQTQNFPSGNINFSSQDQQLSTKEKPPPPPPVPPQKGEVGADECQKLKLKPLHWDKVSASSDRAMVWDQLKFSSFELNEAMIEALFMVNGPSSSSKDNVKQVAGAMFSQQNRVLNQKKSQNVAILLRALNVTVDEVCEALLEGNADALGTELLESLLKIVPSREEEYKVKEFIEESTVKLGPAEKFLKAVLDIPFAFLRVDAMLYIASFDAEVEYLKRSLETLKVACEELKNSRMFLKLLEAVLKAGNRMNVGTDCGNALAFKLDTLLKLVDIKATDGKTTLLHFVVQEISQAEGSKLAGTNQSSKPVQNKESSLPNEIEFLRRGLEVVSSLGGELDNVKKGADLDIDVLSDEVFKLSVGIDKIKKVLKLNEEVEKREYRERFSKSMSLFLNRAEGEIVKVQSLESDVSCTVKDLTKYFHGDYSGKEEYYPFQIFKVVSDFIYILDQVCKDLRKVNERNFVGLGNRFPLPMNSSILPVFPA